MNGDHSAEDNHWIGPVIDRFEGPLIRYARRITGNLDRARDVVQETFVRLCREPRGAVDGHLAEWLFTVCRHRALDQCRKENRMHPLNESMTETCLSREPAQETSLERSDTTAAIFRLLGALPENQQEVVRLKFQNSLSYKQISAITGLTVTNVGYLLHTALTKLREEMKERDGPR